jgi:hypothetical protein
MKIQIDDSLALRELMYDNRCGGPLDLYLFASNGNYAAAQRFVQNVSTPGEEISTIEARQRAESHCSAGGEVRITNAADLLVYHARAGAIIFPPANRIEFFWERAGRQDD